MENKVKSRYITLVKTTNNIRVQFINKKINFPNKFYNFTNIF